MEKKFCPKCGNKTLKRVSVTVDSEGKQQVFTSPTSKPSLDRFTHKKTLVGSHQHEASVDVKGEAVLLTSSKSINCHNISKTI